MFCEDVEMEPIMAVWAGEIFTFIICDYKELTPTFEYRILSGSF
jgi:hypothetical protein